MSIHCIRLLCGWSSETFIIPDQADINISLNKQIQTYT